MSEIININCGKIGNQIGSKFWTNLCEEHGISLDDFKYDGVQPGSIHTYFHETENGRYIPRAILGGYTGLLDTISFAPIGNAFRRDNFILNSTNEGNINEQYEVAIMDSIRKEAESCELLQGFQLCHMINIVDTNIILKIKEDYPNRIMMTYSVSNNSEEDTTDENIFGMDLLIANTDINVMYSNASNWDKASNLGKAMAESTTCFRYPGQFNKKMKHLASNMIPFDRCHFLMSGFFSENDTRTTLPLVENIFSNIYQFNGVDPKHGKYLNAFVSVKSQMNAERVNEMMKNYYAENSAFFVDWIPNNVMVNFISNEERYNSASILTNNTAITSFFNNLIQKKNYSSHTNVLTEEERQNSIANIVDLMDEYQQHEEYVSLLE